MNSAPTAEEQLPPLELTTEDDMKAVRNAGYEMGGNLAAELSCRERQLLAALRENREKDARIAELNRRITISCGRQESFKRRAQAAEAKLRAVSDALNSANFPCLNKYPADEVDARDARIRTIVEGK